MKWFRAARPYWFEIFIAVNFLVLEIVLRRIGLTAFKLLGASFAMFSVAIGIQALAGVASRAIVSRRRGDGYLAVLRTPRYLTGVVRAVIASTLMAHIYGWLKVAVPALNPRLYDQLFWDMDRALFFGLSPNIFFLELFSHPLALRMVDWTYANVFVAGIFISSAFFLSEPDENVRVRFINANVLLWIVGAWLYVALPALDPCYRFPDIWLPLREHLPHTQFLQGLLWNNYHAFRQFLAGQPVRINLLYGLSAFPSLHVAYVFLVYLWIRRLTRWGGPLFAAITVIIFVGSLVTGWHYLVDAIAGIALAVLCYLAFRIRPARSAAHAAAE